MLKENCRDSGSTSYFNASNKYKTSSPSSGRSKNNNNNGSINDINVNQFQELNNYRMTNWKNLVRSRENSRSSTHQIIMCPRTPAEYRHPVQEAWVISGKHEPNAGKIIQVPSIEQNTNFPIKNNDKRVPFWVKPSFYIFLLYIHILIYVYFRIMSLCSSAYKIYNH